MEYQAQSSNDRELYRESRAEGDRLDWAWEPRVFVTEHGGIGMAYYGRVVIRSIKDWVELGWRDGAPTATAFSPSEREGE